MRINIAINGEKAFDWEGGKAEIDRIREAVPKAAEHSNVPPHALADTSLKHLVDHGLVESEAGRKMQIMAVLWRIFEAETGDPEHPGKIGDYVSHTGFDIDIRPGNGGLHIEIRATSKLHS
jgi:hypothetical protein